MVERANGFECGANGRLVAWIDADLLEDERSGLSAARTWRQLATTTGAPYVMYPKPDVA